MRYLFHVYVVDPVAGLVVWEKKVLASTREQAILKSQLPEEVLRRVEDFDILVQQIGLVRAAKDVG